METITVDKVIIIQPFNLDIPSRITATINHIIDRLTSPKSTRYFIYGNSSSGLNLQLKDNRIREMRAESLANKSGQQQQQSQDAAIQRFMWEIQNAVSVYGINRILLLDTYIITTLAQLSFKLKNNPYAGLNYMIQMPVCDGLEGLFGCKYPKSVDKIILDITNQNNYPIMVLVTSAADHVYLLNNKIRALQIFRLPDPNVFKFQEPKSPQVGLNIPPCITHDAILVSIPTYYVCSVDCVVETQTITDRLLDISDIIINLLIKKCRQDKISLARYIKHKGVKIAFMIDVFLPDSLHVLINTRDVHQITHTVSDGINSVFSEVNTSAELLTAAILLQPYIGPSKIQLDYTLNWNYSLASRIQINSPEPITQLATDTATIPVNIDTPPNTAIYTIPPTLLNNINLNGISESEMVASYLAVPTTISTPTELSINTDSNTEQPIDSHIFDYENLGAEFSFPDDIILDYPLIDNTTSTTDNIQLDTSPPMELIVAAPDNKPASPAIELEKPTITSSNTNPVDLPEQPLEKFSVIDAKISVGTQVLADLRRVNSMKQLASDWLDYEPSDDEKTKVLNPVQYLASCNNIPDDNGKLNTIHLRWNNRNNWFQYEPEIMEQVNGKFMESLLPNYDNNQYRLYRAIGIESGLIISRKQITTWYPEIEFKKNQVTGAVACVPIKPHDNNESMLPISEFVIKNIYAKPIDFFLNQYETIYNKSATAGHENIQGCKLACLIQVGNLDIGIDLISRVLNTIEGLADMRMMGNSCGIAIYINIIRDILLTSTDTDETKSKIKTLFEQLDTAIVAHQLAKRNAKINITVTTTANLGSDIQPFFIQANLAHKQQRPEYILKLHTKSDPEWRAKLIDPFLLCPGNLAAYIHRLDTDRKVGAVGTCVSINVNMCTEKLDQYFPDSSRVANISNYRYSAGTVFLTRAHLINDVIELDHRYLKACMLMPFYYDNSLFPGNSPVHTYERCFGYMACKKYKLGLVECW